ncbi:MAG TPA: sulfite exporter TauE/SafE family protein [Longimicrobiales bacterium]|nr:sulfite exporter TauE/SafE family protein [Longimicrobiales bacterium]
MLGLALAMLIGLSLGLLGGGGSILTVPVFVYVLGIEAKPAIAMSLAVVSATAAVGAASHWREGNVAWRTAALFAPFAMAGTYAGARLSQAFSGAAQLTLFALVMLAAAAFMLRGRREAYIDERAASAGGLALVALLGLAVGALTGLVGVGGGFLIVPALVLLARVPMKRAVGTSLLVIALNAASGFWGYLGLVEVRWGFMAAFAGVAIIGILVGTSLARHAPARALRTAFGVFLIAMGLLILYQNRSVLTGEAAANAAAGRPDIREWREARAPAGGAAGEATADAATDSRPPGASGLSA